MRTLDYSKKDDDVKRDGNNYPNIQKLKSTLNPYHHCNEQQFFLC